MCDIWGYDVWYVCEVVCAVVYACSVVLCVCLGDMYVGVVIWGINVAGYALYVCFVCCVWHVW